MADGPIGFSLLGQRPNSRYSGRENLHFGIVADDCTHDLKESVPMRGGKINYASRTNAQKWRGGRNFSKKLHRVLDTVVQIPFSRETLEMDRAIAFGNLRIKKVNRRRTFWLSRCVRSQGLMIFDPDATLQSQKRFPCRDGLEEFKDVRPMAFEGT